jgi:hypothetical protein
VVIGVGKGNQVADIRWLQRRAQGWYCVKEIPRPLQATMGKRRLIKTLGTRDLRAAQARRHAVLVLFDREIAAASTKVSKSATVQSAMEWRAVLDAMTPSQRDHELQYVAWEAESIEEKHGEDAAWEFHDLATGRATPLLQYVDQWLAEGGTKGPLRERTQRQYRSDLSGLETWAKTNRYAHHRSLRSAYCRPLRHGGPRHCRRGPQDGEPQDQRRVRLLAMAGEARRIQR